VKLEHSVRISRPPADVYAYLADPSNLPEWQSAVEEVTWQGGVARAGDRFRETRVFLGRRAASTVEVTAATPGTEFSIAASAGRVVIAARHLLEAVGEGTCVRIELEAENVPRLVAGVATRAAGRQAEADLTRLKERLERTR
jgi:carbon monoxide dehydrogenase subunit G